MNINNNGTSEPPNNNNNNGFDANGLTYILTLVFGVVFLVLSVIVACIRLRSSQSRNILNILSGFSPHRHEDTIMEQGLRHHTDTSFEGYPKLLYSQIQKNGSSTSISCSICLGDYKESDMLRLLPDCDHLYHAACVDPWLMLHSTCPICRKSSLSST